MSNNLHISYDLNSPGQDYAVVIDKIKSLGDWANIHKSYWYVKSDYTATEAVNAVWSVMDKNDTVYVADTSNNMAAWQNIDSQASEFIFDRWDK